jgi:pyruvate dehydrogenase E2 component (dihydrolipoamide acetyltransferase)
MGPGGVSREVRVPKWGLTITTMTITAWLVGVGDSVAEGDPVCEVDTDKSASEIEAPVAGRVVSLLAEVGSEHEVGDVIAMIDPDHG